MLDDAKYLETVLKPIRVCAHYKPKFGQGIKGGGLTLEQFQTLYDADAFYSWFGLSNPYMYAAHKAAGGMTSIYRQIGIGCESLFRRIIQDSFALEDADVIWSYETSGVTGKSRKLKLDGRVPLKRVGDSAKRERLRLWMRDYAKQLGIESKVFKGLNGVVFEVRQGYKSNDSKRQNADITNAATAYVKGYLPCAVILSSQIDQGILAATDARSGPLLLG